MSNQRENPVSSDSDQTMDELISGPVSPQADVSLPRSGKESAQAKTESTSQQAR